MKRLATSLLVLATPSFSGCFADTSGLTTGDGSGDDSGSTGVNPGSTSGGGSDGGGGTASGGSAATTGSGGTAATAGSTGGAGTTGGTGGSTGAGTTAGPGDTTGAASTGGAGSTSGASTGPGSGSSTGSAGTTDGPGTTTGSTGDGSTGGSTGGLTTGTTGTGTTGGDTTGSSTGTGTTGTGSTGTTGVVVPPPECGNGMAEVGEFCLRDYTETDTVNPPMDLVAADFDNNNNIDIFTGQGIDAEFETVLGNGAGLFAMGPYDVSGEPYAYFVARGRINGDGLPDMIWADQADAGVAVRFNDGFGTLAEGVNDGVYPFDTVNSLAVGDIDSNNLTDVIVCTDSGTYLLRANGMGTGVLTQSTIYGFGTHTDAAVAELNGNSAVDVAIVNGTTLRLEFGTNNGSFPTDDVLALNGTGDRIAIGDMDDDGDADIVVTIPDANVVRVLEGAGSGGFSTAGDLESGMRLRDVVMRDFNADGRDDVVMSNQGDDTLSVYLSDPSGGFEPVRTLTLSGDTAREPANMTVADFNGDGALDIAVALTVDSIGLFLSDV